MGATARVSSTCASCGPDLRADGRILPVPQAPTDSRADLTAHLHRAGYYPELVADVLDVALADEQVVSHLVQAETTFDSEVRRHLTVLVLTPTRLVTAHVDDHAGADPATPGSASATTEVVPLREIRSVALTHVIAGPERYPHAGGTREVTLAVGWGPCPAWTWSRPPAWTRTAPPTTA
nr:hypothetical protein GCM10025730_52250 [Promicromonospora thailandica]